jgi:hypothetical protein
MGRNIFADQPQQQLADPQAQAGAAPSKKGRNLFAPRPLDPSFDASQYGKDDLLKAYKELPRDDPRREPIKQQIIKLGNEPFERGIMSQNQTQIAGLTHGASMGLSDEINAGIAGLTGGRISPLGGKTYDEELKLERQQLHNAEKDGPGDYLAGDVVGSLAPAVLTFGASIPETFLGRAAVNIGGGALQGFTSGAADSEGDMGDRLAAGAEGAAWGAGLGALPSIGEAAYKTGRGIYRAGAHAARPLFKPGNVAEDRIVRGMAQDYIDHGKLSHREVAGGRPVPERGFLTAPEANQLRSQGHRVQVSDFGGNSVREELKAASNISPEAATTLRGSAEAHQSGQAQRMVDEISGFYGGEINPKHITDSLEEEGAKWNKKNYAAAMGHPNAGHFWGPAMQNIISSPEGQVAYSNALKVMKTDALNSGVDFLEPVFSPNAVGRMEFNGFRAPNGNMVQGHGLNLNFWNEFKIQIDKQLRDLRVAGSKREAGQLGQMRNDMLGHIDNQLGDGSYAKARGDAKEIFDLVGKNGKGGALNAGGDYFNRMDAFSKSEAKAALDAMNPMEKELFARGFAAQMTNRLHNMGDNESIAKLFKSSEQRSKIYDALGQQNATRIEALAHAEQVQGLLGKRIAGGSDTAKNIFSAENLIHYAGQAAPTAGAGAAVWYATGDYSGLLLGLASGAGYKYVNRRAARRVANMMAEIAISEDPVLIQKLLRRAAADPQYMAFSRAVSSGASHAAGAGARAAAGPAASAAGNASHGSTTINIPGGGLPGGAQRVEPRLFADGGWVEPVKLAGAGLVKEAVEAMERVGRSTVAHPVRKAFPGIYKEPAALLRDVRIEPEDPALKQLFGVNRDDLFEMSKRKGNVKDILGIEGKSSRGSEATDNVQTPRNARRLVNALDAARTNEGFWKGMHGWYTMDPAYQQLVKDYGPEMGGQMFRRLNTLTGMSSPGSEVMTELQRGTAANMMDNRGLWDEFMMFGGTSKGDRGHNFPREIAGVDGHPYHSTSQAPAMDKYLKSGKVEMGSAKVPTYIGASTPPELGNFTDLPIADAHFTRAVGLPDTRTAQKVYDHSMTMGEYKALAPWYRDQVAAQAGLEGVPAQAIHWGLFGPQTGVTTPVGAPKLELLAKGIMETARRMGISPDRARDLVLSGKAHAFEQGGLVSAIGHAA